MKTQGLAKIIISVAVVVLLFLSTARLAGASPVEPLGIRFANFAPPTYHQVDAIWKPFFVEWAQKSGVAIKPAFYHSASLVPADAHYRAIKHGMVEMGFFCPAYTPGVFPLANFVELPSIFPEGQVTLAAHKIWWSAYEQGLLDKPIYEIKAMWPCFSEPFRFWFRKPVRNLDDFKGRKIRTTGGLPSEVVKKLGASPIVLPTSDIIPGLQTGVVDGNVWDFALGNNLKIEEVAPYLVDVDAGNWLGVVAINNDSYARLPPDVRGAFDKLVPEYRLKVAQSYYKLDREGRKALLERGVKVIELNQKDKQQLEAIYKQVWEEWIKSMEEKGYAAKKLVDANYKAGKEFGYTLLDVRTW